MPRRAGLAKLVADLCVSDGRSNARCRLRTARWARHGAGPMAHDSGGEADGSVVILIPLFNDWASFTELVHRLDVVLGEHGLRADVLIVDDGSTIGPSADGVVRGASTRCGGSTCSGCGGTWAISGRSPSAWPTSRAAWRCDAVVVMDGDGEDAPEDVPRLLARLREEEGSPIVFAERTRRSESWGFHVFYAPLQAAACPADWPAGADRQLQRRPPAAAGEPRGGLRALEPLRRGGRPFAATLVHDPHPPGQAAPRQVGDELRRAW